MILNLLFPSKSLGHCELLEDILMGTFASSNFGSHYVHPCYPCLQNWEVMLSSPLPHALYLTRGSLQLRPYCCKICCVCYCSQFDVSVPCRPHFAVGWYQIDENKCRREKMKLWGWLPGLWGCFVCTAIEPRLRKFCGGRVQL